MVNKMEFTEKDGEIAILMVKEYMLRNGLNLQQIEQEISKLSEAMGTSKDELKKFLKKIMDQIIDKKLGP